MKKLLSLLLVLLMLTSASALGEEFSLRNGITFGDTMDEVLDKETFAIDEIDDGAMRKNTDEESEEDESETEFPYSITTQKATLAGIDDSYIVYKFDADKTLREVDYYFRSSSYKDSIDSDYDTVNASLVRKYGAPLGYSNGDCYIFTGSALEGAVLSAYLFEFLGGYGDLRDYDEWDVETDNYHVKIEQVEYYYGSSYSELTYSHRMSYTYFTDEQLDAERTEKQERQEAVDNDL